MIEADLCPIGRGAGDRLSLQTGSPVKFAIDKVCAGIRDRDRCARKKIAGVNDDVRRAGAQYDAPVLVDVLPMICVAFTPV
jgi:hypothetical protein